MRPEGKCCLSLCDMDLTKRSHSSGPEQLAAIKSLRQQTGAPMADVRAALTSASWNQDDAMLELRKKGLAAASKKANRTTTEGLIGLARDGDDCAALAEVNCETDFVARNAEFVSLVGEVAQAALSKPSDYRDCSMDVEELSKETGRSGTSIQLAIESVAAVVREKMEIRRAVRRRVEGGVVGAYLHGAVSPKSSTGRIAALVGLQCIEGQTLDAATAKAARELGDKIAMHVVAMRPLYLDRASVPALVAENEAIMLKEEALSSGKPSQVIDKIVVGRLNKYFQDVCLLENSFVMNDKLRVGDAVAEFNKQHKCDVSLTGFSRLQVGEGVAGQDTVADPTR